MGVSSDPLGERSLPGAKGGDDKILLFLVSNTDNIG
jgi:hypothetical protein